MKITGDITLGNILTIIAMVGALLMFALRIEVRMTRLEVQMEQLIQTGTRQYGAKPRKTVHSVDQLSPLSFLSTPSLPPVSTVYTRKAAPPARITRPYSTRARAR